MMLEDLNDRTYWKTDSNGHPHTVLASYHCDECDVDWDMTHSCACDDECPECGAACGAGDWQWLDPYTGMVREDEPPENQLQFHQPSQDTKA